MTARAKTLAGLAVVAAYLVAAVLTFRYSGLVERPLFDGNHGGSAVPYRWVDPPEPLAGTNLPPEGATNTVRLTRRGSEPFSLATGDSQAVIVLPDRLFPRRGADREVQLEITPLDADSLGVPAPDIDGQPGEFQGNAYRVVATYLPSGRPADIPPTDDCTPRGDTLPCLTVSMVTPYGAIALFRLEGDRWERFAGQEVPSGIFGDSKETGTFVAVAEEGRIANSVPNTEVPSKVGDWIALGLAVLAMLGAAFFYRKRMDAKREEQRRKAMGVKYKPAQKGAKTRPPN